MRVERMFICQPPGLKALDFSVLLFGSSFGATAETDRWMDGGSAGERFEGTRFK